MKMEIIKEKKNPAMKRDEHTISLEHAGKATPSRPEIAKEAAKLLKTKEELIIVDKIFSNKGIQSSVVYVLSYKKKEDIPAHKADKISRRIGMIKPKAEEKPAEAAPAEEKPAEEAKEENTEEKKEEVTEEKAEEAPAEETAEETKEEEKKE